MVHRAQPHLGETGGYIISPAIVVGGILVLILVVCVALYFVVGNTLGSGSAAATGTPAPGQATRTVARPTALPSSITPIQVVASPTPTFTPTPRVAPSATPIKYQVKSGDTLITIATKYGVTVKAIMEANGLKNETIRIGEELIIPPPAR